MSLQRKTFSEGELIRVPAPSKPCVLKSGGPVMDALSQEGNRVLCEWTDDQGKIGRAVFPVDCLYSLVPFSE